MAITYVDVVQWYCDVCQDEGEAGSQYEAEQQAARHECAERGES